jgi:hypothetical protein
MQERGPLQPDIDENSLHPGQHPDNPALVNVPDKPAMAGALYMHLLQAPIL